MTPARLEPVSGEKSALSVEPAKGDPRDERESPPDRLASHLQDYIRQHPAAAIAIAFGVGSLLQVAASAGMEMRAADSGSKTRSRKGPRNDLPPAPLPEPPPEPPPEHAPEPRTHDVGVADMEFTAHHPDRKDLVFKFAFKRRPVDAPETDWPVDVMGFTATRPNGNRTAFKFTRKTRRIPPEYGNLAAGDEYRAGLGWAKMEFKTSRPGRRDFRFTWTKTPPEKPAQTEQPAEISRGQKDDSATGGARTKGAPKPRKRAGSAPTDKGS